jgi:hydrogenase nickel incorporation protein HypA/HybF
MHELSIATAVLNTALKHAEDRPVELVAMRIGALRQVVPDSLQFYWDVVARDSLCENARLEIEEIDALLRCEDCGREWQPLIAAFRCPDCASAQVTVAAGEELEIDYLELASTEPPNPVPPGTAKEPMHA